MLRDNYASIQFLRSNIVGGSYVLPFASRRSSRRVVHSSTGPSTAGIIREIAPDSR